MDVCIAQPPAGETNPLSARFCTVANNVGDSVALNLAFNNWLKIKLGKRPASTQKGGRMKISELLSDPARHCKGAYARDAKGQACRSDSPNAVAWCLNGAINCCYSGKNQRLEVYWNLIATLKRLFGYELLSVFNDCCATTPEDVKKLTLEADV